MRNRFSMLSKPRPTHALALAIALACTSSHAQTHPAANDLTVVPFNKKIVLKRGEAINVTLSREVRPSEGQVAICIGPLDLSRQTSAIDAKTYRADTAGGELPNGEHEVVVHLIRGDQWIDIGKFAVTVEDASAPSSTNFDAKVTLNLKGQVHEGASGTTKSGTRPKFQDFNLTSALALEGKPFGFDVKSSANLAGVSQRKQALRFGIDANEAQKVDLNDYKTEFARGDLKFALGHLSYGNHPLLLNNRDSRGITLGYAVAPWLDVSGSAIRASSVVGFDDFFGLSTVDHRIYAATLGVELQPSKRGLIRGELIFMDAKAMPEANFNQGQIPDAEQSRGLGVRLSTADPEGRWRADTLFARSRYLNPTHPELAQGSPLVPINAETRDAYQADAMYLVVKDAAWFGERWKTTLRAIGHYAYAEPLFKSLGASFIADQQMLRYGGEGKLGDVELKFAASRKNDNVTTIPTILKTGTYERDAQLTVPLPQLLGTSEKPSNAWPQVQLQSLRARQYTLRIPDGTNARSSFWPDQINRTQKATLNWSYDPFTVGYNLEFAHQDNRQPERDRADFLIQTHGLTLAWRVNDKLAINSGYNRSRNFSYEKTQATYNNGGTFNIDWQMSDRWSLKLDYSKTLAFDSLDEQYSNVASAAIQVARKFEIEQFGKKFPGQLFVRAGQSNNRALDNVVKQVLKGKQTLVQTGLSLNF